METKRCTRCNEVKSVTEFWVGRPDCKRCWGEFKKKRRRDNPIKVRLTDNNYMAKYGKTSIGKYYKVKTNLAHRGLKMIATRSEFVSWFEGTLKECHYCHTKLTLSNNGRHHHLTDLTIDRKDNNQQYSIDNLVLACRRCNIIKGSWFTESDMLEIANRFFNKFNMALDLLVSTRICVAYALNSESQRYPSSEPAV